MPACAAAAAAGGSVGRAPPRRARLLAVALGACGGLLPLPGQDGGGVRTTPAVDPYTGGDAKAMAAAGIAAYGPFPWADFHTTAEVDRVLGATRMIWLETAHFRIGSSLPSQDLPTVPDKRRALLADLAQLRRRLPRVPERPRTLDPWLRLHLYACRAEACYAGFQELIGVTDADFGKGPRPRDGAYLGLPDKFLLLLFQKKADLARYMDRFCGVQSDQLCRFYHQKTFQMLAALGVEGLDNFDDAALHRYVVYLLTHNLLCGYQGHFYPLPFWFDEGLAHWMSRQVESEYVITNLRDDESVDQEKQHEWASKVRRRARHEGTWIPFATMCGWQKWDEMGFQAHAQAWSRVDHLMSRGPEKVGQFIRGMKNLPLDPAGGLLPRAEVDAMQTRLLAELWGLDAPGFDRQWREWVLKTYPAK